MTDFASFKTIGDFISAVLKVPDATGAIAFYEAFIEDLMTRGGHSLETAQKRARSDIGWVLGEGMTDAQIIMWQETTGALHPVLGRSMVPHPTFDELLHAGISYGQRQERERVAQEESFDAPGPDEKRYPSREEILRRLGDSEWIHTFRDGGVVLLGADWGRAEILEALDKYPFEDAGPDASSMGHTLAFHDDAGAVFVEAGPSEEA